MVELKNTLSGLFFFAAILAYLNFDHTEGYERIYWLGSYSHSESWPSNLLRPFPQSCSS